MVDNLINILKSFYKKKQVTIKYYKNKDLFVKKIITLLAAFIITTPIFADINDLVATGWRKNVVTTHCDEYDVMIGDDGYWVVKWGVDRELVKAALIRDGFDITETDSSITWKQSSIYRCEIQFNKNHRLKTVMCIITVPINSGISISRSLQNKLVAMYGSSGKFKMIGSSSSYSWLDQRCEGKPIYTLIANSIVEGGSYIITIISSPIGE
jgi:hypothetical protein